MNEQNSDDKNELLKYFVEKKPKGASFRTIVDLMEKKGIEPDTRRFIINKLDELDKIQKVQQEKNETKSNRANGIKNLLIGIGFLIFSFFIFLATAKFGRIAYLNIGLAGFGLVKVFQGLFLGIIGGQKN